jgi:hypothetical protein
MPPLRLHVTSSASSLKWFLSPDERPVSRSQSWHLSPQPRTKEHTIPTLIPWKEAALGEPCG